MRTEKITRRRLYTPSWHCKTKFLFNFSEASRCCENAMHKKNNFFGIFGIYFTEKNPEYPFHKVNIISSTPIDASPFLWSPLVLAVHNFIPILFPKNVISAIFYNTLLFYKILNKIFFGYLMAYNNFFFSKTRTHGKLFTSSMKTHKEPRIFFYLLTHVFNHLNFWFIVDIWPTFFNQ